MQRRYRNSYTSAFLLIKIFIIFIYLCGRWDMHAYIWVCSYHMYVWS